jgi:hypothetical protein
MNKTLIYTKKREKSRSTNYLKGNYVIHIHILTFFMDIHSFHICRDLK